MVASTMSPCVACPCEMAFGPWNPPDGRLGFASTGLSWTRRRLRTGFLRARANSIVDGQFNSVVVAFPAGYALMLLDIGKRLEETTGLYVCILPRGVESGEF